MFRVVASSWALLLGMAMLMMGNGLQGTLLGFRAAESFTTATAGLVMSGYYLGFLAGSTLTPKVIKTVGHVRVFASLASIASTAILIHGVFVDPISWLAMRFVTGFAYAGIYVVAESWLNDRATNETRGQLLAVYMVIILGDMALGQFLMNVADPNGMVLFVLSSVLISLALLPIALSAGPTPAFEIAEKVGVFKLYRLSPLGVVGTLLTNMGNAVLIGMGAVYGAAIGLSVVEISIFMGVIIVGGMVAQWPIGRLSDRFDRRRVITIVTLLAGIFAFAALPFGGVHPWAIYGIAFLFGTMAFPMYSLCIAHTNDNLTPVQIVPASGTLVFVGGIGASGGPILAATVMSFIGPEGYFVTLGVVHSLVGVFALYRMSRRAAVPLEEQGTTVPVASGVAAVTASFSTEALRDQKDRDMAEHEDTADRG